MLKKVGSLRELRILPSSPISGFIKKDHICADQSELGMLIQKCHLLRKTIRMREIVAVLSCNILSGGRSQALIQGKIKPHSFR